MALTQVKTTGLADDAVTGAKIADDTVAEANMANDAISLAELKAGTDGQIITYDASGNPTAVGPGTDGQVLTSTGAGSPPAFEALPASNNYVHPNHSGEVTSTADGAQVIASDVVDEDNLKISNSPTNGYFLSAQSGNTGGLTWAEAGGGKILSYQYAASSSTYTNTTSTTFVDSVITDAITTTKLNSKILVQANFRFWCNRSSGHNVVGTRVRRTEGTADEFIFMNNSQNWKFPSDIHSGMGSHIWVDSPTKAAGTEITYNIQARVHDTSSSQAWQIDSWHMVLMELDI